VPTINFQAMIVLRKNKVDDVK